MDTEEEGLGKVAGSRVVGVEDAKIGWPARKTNEVLMGVQENRMLLQAILNRKGNWLGIP